MSLLTGSALQRRRIVIQGIVQGVGFRPFVYGQALQWGLVGFVLNDSGGVTIEVEGDAESLNGFQQALQENAPPLARIDMLIAEPIEPCYDSTFSIVESQSGTERQALISPDTSTCDDCLHELFDSGDRRYRYPFINCTNCGPRFTIIQDVPYDRDKTTMHVFPMCRECQSEYENPLNRRFHAQPNACPVCGPQVYLLDRDGNIHPASEIKMPIGKSYTVADKSAMGTINRPLRGDEGELKAHKSAADSMRRPIGGVDGDPIAEAVEMLA